MKTKLIKIGSYLDIAEIEFQTNSWIRLHPEYDLLDVKIIPTNFGSKFILYALVKTA